MVTFLSKGESSRQKTVPMKMSNSCRKSIDLCLCGDQRYLAGLIITAVSTVISTPGDQGLRFHFLIAGQVDAMEAMIRRTLSSLGREIVIIFYRIDTTEFEGFPEFFFDSPMLYARLLIPEILQVPRVVYLDCDFLVTRNLSELYQLDLGGHVAAAVRDLSVDIVGNDVASSGDLGMDQSHFALNSGLLVLDLDSIRVNGNFRRALTILKERPDLCKLHDQSALSYGLYGAVMELSVVWNCMTNHYAETGRALLGSHEWVNWHFVTNQKPWMETRQVMPFVAFNILLRELRRRKVVSIPYPSGRIRAALHRRVPPVFALIYFAKAALKRLLGDDVASDILQVSAKRSLQQSVDQIMGRNRHERLFLDRWRAQVRESLGAAQKNGDRVVDGCG